MNQSTRISNAGRCVRMTIYSILVTVTGLGSVLNAQEAFPPPSELKRMSVEQLLDLEVTSVSKRPEKLSEAASAIQVITGDEIRRSGASSLPEALRLASNLEVAQVNSRQWAISARGLNTTTANEVLVLIDGRSVYTPRVAGVYWDVQDTILEDLDRIEVISGPGAALWGADAVNGVINITTKPVKETQGVLVEGGGGTELRGFGGVRYGGVMASNVYFRIYGKYADRDSTVYSGGGDGTNQWRMGHGGARIDWEASDLNLFTLQGDGYGGTFEQPGFSTNGAVDGGNVLGRWTHTIAADSDFKLQMYYDRTHRDTPGTVNDYLNTYDIDFQHRFPICECQDFIWGLGYRNYQDEIQGSAAQVYLPDRFSLQVFSGFAQDEITLIKDKVHLTLGTKVERNDFTGFEVQPGARLSWVVTGRQTLWGAVSRAVRTPALNDRYLFTPATAPYSSVGGANFTSEELVAYELGYRFQPIARLGLSVATFYDDYANIRSLELVSPGGPYTTGNGQHGESFGAEVVVDYRVLDSWRLRAGFTEIHSRLRPEAGSTDTSYGANEAHDPEHQFSLHSYLDLPGRLELDGGFRFISSIGNQGVPAYSELDLRLAWHPTSRLEISLVGQNLLHEQHAEFNPLSVRQEIERGFYGKVVWRF